MRPEHVDYSQQQKPPNEKNWWLSFSGIITIIFIVLLGYYLLTEHKTHIAQFISAYGLLFIILLCPLKHLLMHRGHRNKGTHPRHQHKGDDNTFDKKKG